MNEGECKTISIQHNSTKKHTKRNMSAITQTQTKMEEWEDINEEVGALLTVMCRVEASTYVGVQRLFTHHKNRSFLRDQMNSIRDLLDELSNEGFPERMRAATGDAETKEDDNEDEDDDNEDEEEEDEDEEEVCTWRNVYDHYTTVMTMLLPASELANTHPAMIELFEELEETANDLREWVGLMQNHTTYRKLEHEQRMAERETRQREVIDLVSDDDEEEEQPSSSRPREVVDLSEDNQDTCSPAKRAKHE